MSDSVVLYRHLEQCAWNVWQRWMGLLVEGHENKQVSWDISQFMEIGNDLKQDRAISASLVCVLPGHLRLNKGLNFIAEDRSLFYCSSWGKACCWSKYPIKIGIPSAEWFSLLKLKKWPASWNWREVAPHSLSCLILGIVQVFLSGVE